MAYDWLPTEREMQDLGDGRSTDSTVPLQDALSPEELRAHEELLEAMALHPEELAIR